MHLGALELLVVFLVLSILLFQPELLASSIIRPLLRVRWLVAGLMIVFVIVAILAVRYGYRK
jgi:hypothetical protein